MSTILGVVKRQLRKHPPKSVYIFQKYCNYRTGSSSSVTVDRLDELPGTNVTHLVGPMNLFCVTVAPLPKKEIPILASRSPITHRIHVPHPQCTPWMLVVHTITLLPAMLVQLQFARPISSSSRITGANEPITGEPQGASRITFKRPELPVR